MVRKVLLVVVGFSVVLTAAVTIAMSQEATLSLELKRFYLEAYKAIGVGFLVALLAAIIPQMLQEARDQFERFKDSREAYSRAKTSIIYLPERLATLSFGEAVLVVQDAHAKLHLAETYKKELPKHASWYRIPEIWSEQMYWEIEAIKEMLQSNVDNWSVAKANGDRMRPLCNIVAAVRSIYDAEDIKKAKSPSAKIRRKAKTCREAKIRETIDSMIKISPK